MVDCWLCEYQVCILHACFHGSRTTLWCALPRLTAAVCFGVVHEVFHPKTQRGKIRCLTGVVCHEVVGCVAEDFLGCFSPSFFCALVSSGYTGYSKRKSVSRALGISDRRLSFVEFCSLLYICVWCLRYMRHSSFAFFLDDSILPFFMNVRFRGAASCSLWLMD